MPLVKKLVCSNHNYLYSFSHNIDFNERLEAIGSLVREDYLRDFVLIGLPFNRFVVDCACAQGSESYLNKMRSYAFKVQEASAIGFPNGIASDVFMSFHHYLIRPLACKLFLMCLTIF